MSNFLQRGDFFSDMLQLPCSWVYTVLAAYSAMENLILMWLAHLVKLRGQVVAYRVPSFFLTLLHNDTFPA